MALDVHMFQSLNPSQFISFSFPNPCHSDSSLRIAVLDSPIEPTDSVLVAVMFVPSGRETDWIFSTESGHYQLLFNSPGISRLILVGNEEPVIGDDSLAIYNRSSDKDSASSWRGLAVRLQPLFLDLFPKSCFQNGIPDVPILSYVDNVICRVVLERCIGSSVGEFQVENVEIKRESGTGIFESPMAASLSLISSSIDEQIRTGHRPKALCLGVGGGALLSFLANHLDFEVMGVEMDSEVHRIAQQYFGLAENEFLHISIGGAIEFLETASKSDKKQNSESFDAVHMSSEYDVIMVDLGSSDARNSTRAPPLEFVGRDFLKNARSVLSEHGILVMNVIPPDNMFFETLVENFRSVFDDLFKIDVDNRENFVVIASVRPIKSSPDVAENKMNSFLSRLGLLLSGAYMDSINKI